MTRTLNLDSQFTPVVQPEIEYDMFQFNGGEWHIKLNTNIDFKKVVKVIITARITTGDDIIKLLITYDALKQAGIKVFDLVMPYIPYARQDRKCEEGESFSLKVFANLINSMNFDKVYTLDSHSDVAPALINNCENIPNNEYVEWAYHYIAEYDNAEITLISPDAGANKKANKLMETGLFHEIIKCDKIRDTKTGTLTGFEVFANDIKGKCCLIVDDICDGGGTFIGIAKELKKKNAGNLYLFVTHGIFSKGIEELNKHFNEVFCTNSFKDIDNINQFKIQL